MSQDADKALLEAMEHLSPKERAAALGHWIYVLTAHRLTNEWTLRVNEAWEDLDARSREFNLAGIDTWAQSPAVFAAWTEAVAAYAKEIGASK